MKSATRRFIEQHAMRIKAACDLFGVRRLWLIGSRSRGDENPNSDWDWMVVMDEHSPARHEAFIAAMSLFCSSVHVLTLRHVMSQFCEEDSHDALRDAVSVVRNDELVPMASQRGLLSVESYRSVFWPWRNRRAGYLRANGNIGDRMIDAATEFLCDSYGVSLIDIVASGSAPSDLDVIFSAGAGNLGRYAGDRANREWALTTGLPVVVLPQTAGGDAEILHPYHTVWLRDHVSAQYRPDGVFAPDLALALPCPIHAVPDPCRAARACRRVSEKRPGSDDG